MNPLKKTLTVSAGIALAVSLTGCIPMDEPTLSDGPSTTEESTTPEDDGIGTFGQVASWDGADLVVSKPKKYTPSDSAGSMNEFPDTISMDVKLTNTGDEPLDPALVFITVSSAEEEGSPVMDIANNIDLGPTTKIKPGKSVKWTVVFNVADAKDLLVEVSPPNMLDESVLFSTEG